MIPLAEPLFNGNESQYLNECIDSTWVSSQGRFVAEFEHKFAKNAVAVSSGTAALHLALKSCNVSSFDEVIVPDFTFCAVPNAVIHCGAAPVLVDVDKSWNIDPTLIEEKINYRTKVIIAVHSYGNPCDMDAIMEISKKRGILVIEDCAEAQGALYNGVPVGTIGNFGCYSFFANKIMTTGEGGMVVSDNDLLTDHVRLLRDHGMRPRYNSVKAGFNYRMTNMQAALGVAQLERIEEILARRSEIQSRYRANLGDLSIQPNDGVCWLFTVLVDNPDSIAMKLEDKGIQTRRVFNPLHIQKPYLPPMPTSFPMSNYIAEHGLSLPSGNAITNDQIDFVCDKLMEAVHQTDTAEEAPPATPPGIKTDLPVGVRC